MQSFTRVCSIQYAIAVITILCLRFNGVAVAAEAIKLDGKSSAEERSEYLWQLAKSR
jgi:hypothetical protein